MWFIKPILGEVSRYEFKQNIIWEELRYDFTSSFFFNRNQVIKLKCNKKLILRAQLNMKNTSLTAKSNYIGNADLCPNLCGSIFPQKSLLTKFPYNLEKYP